jgi:hypothetical protein
VQEVLALSPQQELADKQRETEFGTALCAVTILRYLTDHVGGLPLGLLSRLSSANDTLMGLLPLVERPPWVRTRKGKVGGLGGRARAQGVGGRGRREGWAIGPPTLEPPGGSWLHGQGGVAGGVMVGRRTAAAHGLLPASGVLQVERYEGNRWQQVAPEDRLRVGQADAQVGS